MRHGNRESAGIAVRAMGLPTGKDVVPLGRGRGLPAWPLNASILPTAVACLSNAPLERLAVAGTLPPLVRDLFLKGRHT